MLSQKITTKKDKVLVDGKEVAILNDKVRDVYVFTDLNGNKQITATYRGLSEGQTIINQWLEVASADGSSVTEIPYDVLITSFSPSRIIAHLLATKYNLFDANGFNKANIDSFFATDRESISEKSLRAKTDAIVNKQEKQEKRKETWQKNAAIRAVPKKAAKDVQAKQDRANRIFILI